MAINKIKLGDYCQIEKGKTGIKKAIPGEYPMVVTAEKRITNNEYNFDCKAVIIPLVSSTGHGHASIKRLHYQENKFALGTILAALIVKDESVLDPRFLFIYLSYFKDQLLVPLMKGSANVSLNIGKISGVEIILPSIERQKEIIKLEKENSQILRLKNEIVIQIDLASKLRRLILQEAIEGKLTQDWRRENPDIEPANQLLKQIKKDKKRLIKGKKIKTEKMFKEIGDSNILFDLPRSWVRCRFGDLINISSGDGLTSKQMIEGDIPVFGGNGINGYHNEYNTSEETVTIGRVGAYCGAVHLTPQFSWITDNCFRVYFDKKSIFKDYLIWYLKYLNLGKMSYKGSQPVISSKRVYPLLTFLPPLQEQKEIVKKIEELTQRILALEEELRKSEESGQILMQAVLKEAFRDN